MMVMGETGIGDKMCPNCGQILKEILLMAQINIDLDPEHIVCSTGTVHYRFMRSIMFLASNAGGRGRWGLG